MFEKLVYSERGYISNEFLTDPNVNNLHHIKNQNDFAEQFETRKCDTSGFVLFSQERHYETGIKIHT